LALCDISGTGRRLGAVCQRVLLIRRTLGPSSPVGLSAPRKTRSGCLPRWDSTMPWAADLVAEQLDQSSLT